MLTAYLFFYTFFGRKVNIPDYSRDFHALPYPYCHVKCPKEIGENSKEQ